MTYGDLVVGDGEVMVVHRVASLLECFSYNRPEWGISDLAAALDLPTSTVHRLAASLVTAGLLERPTRGRYRLGLKLHELGQTAVFTTALRERGHPYLEHLRRATGHTAQLAVLSGTDAVYVDRLEDPVVFGRFGQSGQRVPAYACSSGKALLAFGGPEVGATLEAIARRGMVRRAPRTITSMPRLREELATIARRGYAESMEETWPDMTSVAVPVIGAAGTALASLSIAGPVARFDAAARQRAVRLARSAARQLGQHLV